MNFLRSTKTKKSNSIVNFIKFMTFISIVLTCLKLAIMGRLEPETIGILLVATVIILAVGNRILYVFLGIASFYLFIKLYAQTPEEEYIIISQLLTLGIILFVIFKIVKRIFG